MFSEVYIGKTFVSKGNLLSFFSLLPTLEPESPFCDRILCLWHPSPPTVAHGDVTNEELWFWQGKQMKLKETKIFFACSCPWSWRDGGGKWDTELQLTLHWPDGQNYLCTECCARQQGVAAYIWLLHLPPNSFSVEGGKISSMTLSYIIPELSYSPGTSRIVRNLCPEREASSPLLWTL